MVPVNTPTGTGSNTSTAARNLLANFPHHHLSVEELRHLQVFTILTEKIIHLIIFFTKTFSFPPLYRDVRSVLEAHQTKTDPLVMHPCLMDIPVLHHRLIEVIATIIIDPI